MYISVKEACLISDHYCPCMHVQLCTCGHLQIQVFLYTLVILWTHKYTGVFIYSCVPVDTYRYRCSYIYLFTCGHPHIQVFLYTLVYLWTPTDTGVLICTCLHVDTYRYRCSYIHLFTCGHLQIQVFLYTLVMIALLPVLYNSQAHMFNMPHTHIYGNPVAYMMEVVGTKHIKAHIPTDRHSDRQKDT